GDPERDGGPQPLRDPGEHVVRPAGGLRAAPGEGAHPPAEPRQPGEVPQHLGPRDQANRGEEAGEEVTGEVNGRLGNGRGTGVTRGRNAIVVALIQKPADGVTSGRSGRPDGTRTPPGQLDTLT